MSRSDDPNATPKGKKHLSLVPSQAPEGEEDTLDLDEDINEFEDMEMLEMLESLREDMEELGVKSLDEVNQRIAVLHEKLNH